MKLVIRILYMIVLLIIFIGFLVIEWCLVMSPGICCFLMLFALDAKCRGDAIFFAALMIIATIMIMYPRLKEVFKN